ncbi:MAG: 3-isopropylmalate dehydratase large subunit [Candidatus Caenarcaniphilales bacterium]|nr:3-isopropylmalate dehydratase large subunit [Candidatus Caenarcaniphilales bacterium]
MDKVDISVNISKDKKLNKNLFNKVWDSHAVKTLSSGQTQLFIDLHLIHEVTSPQAFGMLRSSSLDVMYPNKTFATVDHIIPTDTRQRPFQDSLAEDMIVAIKKNCEEFGIKFFGVETGDQGIVHVVGPEKGLTQPGMTIVCGDSHTSTHGAFGSIAFGIGTSQVRDVLATQTLAINRLKVRRINVNGDLKPGVYAKDVILHIIKKLGVKGGIGYAYEYGGSTIENMNMEERMTLCNMSIEGGARVGYVNPDQKTFDYLKDREYSPKGEKWQKAVEYWKSLASDSDAEYDDIVNIEAVEIAPTVTWGINPGQAMSIEDLIPSENEVKEEDKLTLKEALEYMDLKEHQPIAGTKIDVAFIGSCTNGRLSDLEEVAKYVKGQKVSSKVKALVVPGSMRVKLEAENKGLDKVFEEAGFEWREAGCSMCLAMNPDKLQGRQLCASSSNRNFKGRQGSPSGRTVLMSPVMVAAAAITGEITDARKLFNE